MDCYKLELIGEAKNLLDTPECSMQYGRMQGRCGEYIECARLQMHQRDRFAPNSSWCKNQILMRSLVLLIAAVAAG
jgi:hypothetical protein